LTQFEEFKKVIKTLSRLSHTPEAISRGLKPFPESLSPTSLSSSSNDDIYCNLQNQIDTVDETIYGVCHYSNESNDIYDRIVTQPQGKSTFEKFVPKSKREHQIKELLETETNYLRNCLEMLINDFYRPLKNCLTTTDYQKIFRNIHDIYLLHSSFHANLQAAVHEALGIAKNTTEDGEVLGIGDVFMKHKSSFLKYAEYCANMDEARLTLDNVEKTEPHAKRKIQELLQESKTDFRLQDLLTVPFQRICKYHLILQNIVSSTTVQSMERERLVNGLEACKDVVDYVNEAKRDKDNQQVIAHIERSIIGMDPKSVIDFYSFGRLKLDGLVKLTDFKDTQPKSKQRYVFVFERVILICKKLKNDIFNFKNSYELKNYSIQDTQTESPTSTTKSNSTLTRIKSAARFDYNTLTMLNAVNQHTIQIDLKSVPQKKLWKEAIEFAINKSNPSEGKAKFHVLTYKTYDSPTECSTCHKLLKGSFYQGYHCSRCNRNLHFECINQAYCGRQRSTLSGISESNIQVPRSERFIALQAIKSQDPEVLNFDLHEEIIIFGETDNGILIGRRAICPGRSGLVAKNTVRPLSSLMHRNSVTSLGVNNMNESNSAPNIQNCCPSVLASRKLVSHCPTGLDIQNHSWYFGCKERTQANEILGGTPDGTFIVRLSQRENKYVISISYGGACKHMKIEARNDPEKRIVYFLHDAKEFSSIPELIEYYHANSLSEGFDRIDTKLLQTLLKTRLYKVVCNYSRESETAKYLTLKKGDKVEVLETTGEDNGWWRFKIHSDDGDRVGFFPMAYVVPVVEEENDDTNGSINGVENMENGF
jgi:guanine nucleotide exchange factor VAV